MSTITPGTEREWLQGPAGDQLSWLTGEDETAGAYSLLERIAPAGARSAPHSHKTIEAFYVLAGEFEFIVGSETTRGGPGTLAIAREGESHGWSVVGEQEGRMLLFFSPSTPRAFYRDLDEIVQASGGSPEPTSLLEVSRKHGIV